MRLDKYLTTLGIGSRSQAKELIKKGKVKVNNITVNKPETHINEEEDVVNLDGLDLNYHRFYYYMLNKPKDVVTAVSDFQYTTVIDIMDVQPKKGLFPVGRLDKDTEGLLLLTNDGVWGHSIINGNKHVEKVYYVEFEGELTEDGIQRIKEGIVLGDGTHCKPALIDVLSPKSVHITIEEGKYHQVKRMIGAAGGTVTYLKRLTIGHIDLTGIEEIGSVQDLSSDDIEAFKK